ncbi:MAG TPA: hypothetical protein VFE44_01340 [Thermoanaerobaculia bacterium]|nr:hypothetical protein [Thermoanaerobaculia bacterium]
MPTRQKCRRCRPLPLLMLAAALLAPAVATGADVDFGIRAGEYTDIGEPFIGVEINYPITRDWWFNPNLEYVLVDDGDLMTINGDFHYDFHVDRPLYVWAGGGPALILSDQDDRPGRRDDDDDENDFGLNLLGGVGFQAGPVVPYGQIKAIVSDENEFVIAFGVRF